MALVGNIQDFGLSDFLYLVDRGYKTGGLHLERENQAAILYFEKGKLIYGSQKKNEKIVDLLLHLGKLTPQQTEQIKKSQQSTNDNTTVTQIIVNENIIPSDELQSVLQTHVEEQVYTLFGWPDGEFRFEHGQKPANDAPIMPIPVPVEHLIMEGVRRIDEWGRIRDRIPSTDMIPKFVEQPGEKAKGVKLAPDEWRVFARINGKDSLASIAQGTKLSEFDVCRVVYGFLTAGLVEVMKKPRPADLATDHTPRLKRSLVSRIISRVQSM